MPSSLPHPGYLILEDLQDNYARLKGLSPKELSLLRKALFEEILQTTLKNGGHLGSNLSSLDITLAIHHVFDLPDDRLIFDVGHQSYAHKLLSGRLKTFSTLRQAQGLSGFTKREESPFDPFGAGHASTSISAALGIAHARNLKKSKNNVIALIGDGALSGGLSFEGLNNISSLKGQFLIILNDNAMSISSPTGSLTELFQKARYSPPILDFKSHLKHLELKAKGDLKEIFKSKLPSPLKQLIHKVSSYAHQIPDALENFSAESAAFFKSFGLNYIGPVNGHDLPFLVDILKNIQKTLPNTPTLLHIHTNKGHDYSPAMASPHRLHAVSPQSTPTEKKKPSSPPATFTYSEVFGKTLCQLAQQDPSIVAITAAMAIGTGLCPFAEKFPDRFFDVGIAEGHGATFAAGLATEGLTPVFALYSTFMPRALDQIIHDVSIQNLPVCFALDRAGCVGPDGPTHHGGLDTAILLPIPSLTIAAPSDGQTLSRLLKTFLTIKKGPSVLRYPRATATSLETGTLLETPFTFQEQDIKPLPIGKGRILTQGKKIALLCLGHITLEVAKTVRHIKEVHGHTLTLADMLFLKPLDEDLVCQLATTHDHLITIEEGSMSGLKAAAMDCLNKHTLLKNTQFHSFCLPDFFPAQESIENQRASATLTADHFTPYLEALLTQE